MMILHIDNVTYMAGNIEILKGISLEIKRGECISIIGPSGSGKSTLLKLLADLIPITSGDIYYNNINYSEYDPIELRKIISYCVQVPYLFGDTVADNLEFLFKIRKQSVNMDRILELLRRFNLDKSYINKKINQLSGGEKQRIALIRNLLYIPDILLLDEVTSALDKKNGQIIEKYIKELNNLGVTVIWVTHNLEQSKRIFTKRIVMERGKIEKVEEIG